MKPLYFKIVEEKQVSFVKVVRSGSFATVGLLIQSAENSWATRAIMYDLNKEKDKQDYITFIENCSESNRNEFDEASRKLLKETDTLSKGRTKQDNGKK